MDEVWKDIPGYEGEYQVSNIGRVRSLDRTVDIANSKYGNHKRVFKGRILKPKIAASRGYPFVMLRLKNEKTITISIHRCVCMAFLPNPNGYNDVNHKNGIRTDNRVENLEWCTRQYNIWHSYYVNMRKPSGCKSVRCVETGIVYPSCLAASRAMGIDNSSIAGVASGVYKQMKGYHFQFVTA